MEANHSKSLIVLVTLLAILAVVSYATPFLNLSNQSVSAAKSAGTGTSEKRQTETGETQQNRTYTGTRGSNSQGRGTSAFTSSSTRALKISGLFQFSNLSSKTIAYINYFTGLFGAGLSGLSALWIWQKKNRGLNLALLVGLFFLIGSMFGVFAGVTSVTPLAIFRYVLVVYTFTASIIIMIMSSQPSIQNQMI